MFGMPLTTEYDAKFHLLGIPVRINPFFWLTAALLGWNEGDGLDVLIWVACVFVSIMVHEFGHALTTRSAFNNKPSVILYYMGGLCFSNGREDNPWKRALVIIMGPVAGFLLCGIVVGLGLWILGVAPIPFIGGIHRHDYPLWFRQLPVWAIRAILAAYSYLIYINFFWGLVNLLPIYPLDGGQLTQVFLTMHNRREAAVRTHAIGLVTAGLLAVYLFSIESNFNAFFVAGLGIMNFQLYQAARMQYGSFSQFEEDDDWWRR